MGTNPALLDATAFSLESRQAPSSLREVLSAAKGKPLNRIAAVIEAGETLHHAGLEPKSLVLIMKDCLLKDLDPQQIKRVAEHVTKKFKKAPTTKPFVMSFGYKAYGGVHLQPFSKFYRPVFYRFFLDHGKRIS